MASPEGASALPFGEPGPSSSQLRVILSCPRPGVHGQGPLPPRPPRPPCPGRARLTCFGSFARPPPSTSAELPPAVVSTSRARPEAAANDEVSALREQASLAARPTEGTAELRGRPRPPWRWRRHTGAGPRPGPCVLLLGKGSFRGDHAPRTAGASAALPAPPGERRGDGPVRKPRAPGCHLHTPLVSSESLGLSSVSRAAAIAARGSHLRRTWYDLPAGIISSSETSQL
ncbi:uncharacterized protein LOC144317025 [Canis aureus]